MGVLGTSAGTVGASDFFRCFCHMELSSPTLVMMMIKMLIKMMLIKRMLIKMMLIKMMLIRMTLIRMMLIRMIMIFLRHVSELAHLGPEVLQGQVALGLPQLGGRQLLLSRGTYCKLLKTLCPFYKKKM